MVSEDNSIRNVMALSVTAVPDGVKAKNRPLGLAAAPATNLVIVMLVMFWFIKGRVKGRVSMLVETGA